MLYDIRINKQHNIAHLRKIDHGRLPELEGKKKVGVESATFPERMVCVLLHVHDMILDSIYTNCHPLEKTAQNYCICSPVLEEKL